MSLTILYRDAQLIAIDKPPGLLTHRTPLDFYETRFALQLLRDQIGQRVYPVHRLDKGTSGVLLFALDPETERQAKAAFEEQQVQKEYLAVVRGHPPASGCIDHPLKPKPDRVEFVDPRATLTAQPARTRFVRLATVELPWAIDRYPHSRYALLRLFPETGRRHQLRRHLKHSAHPIIGDATYGKGVHNRAFADQLDCARLLLACTALTLPHPANGRPLRINAPLSGAFAALLDQLGWADALTDSERGTTGPINTDTPE